MRIHVIIPDDVLAEIDRQVGPRGRSKFLSEAASEKMRRIRLLNAINKLADALDEEAPPEWATSESTAEWVRRGRQTDNSVESPWEITEPHTWADTSSTRQP